MEQKEFCGKMINRIFDADITWGMVSNICYEAMDFGFEAVQIFPNMIPKAKAVIAGRKLNICSLISYPHGTFLAEQKAYEIHDAVKAGAAQVEVCINCLNVRSKDWCKVREEMRLARAAAKNIVLKFILEVEYLTEDQIKACAQIAVEEGIDCLVTSTGLYNTLDENKQDVPITAKPEEIHWIKDITGDQVKIVAQGNVKTLKQAEVLLEAGADYISSQYAAEIIRQYNTIRREKHVR